MDSEKVRKRKRIYRPYAKYLSPKYLTLCMSFFVFLLFVSSDRSPFRTASFRPVLRVPSLSLQLTRDDDSVGAKSRPPLIIEDRVLMPDHLLLILSSKIDSNAELECLYYKNSVNASEKVNVFKRAISIDQFHDHSSIVRCDLQPENFSAAVELRLSGGGGDVFVSFNQNDVVSWDRMVYEAALDWSSAVVFAKGFNLRPHRDSDPSEFRCHFGLNNKFDDNEGFIFTTEATAAAQEVIRCLLPRSIRNTLEKAEGIRVTISRVDPTSGDVVDEPLPSVAKVHQIQPLVVQKKYELCACTMLWNQANFLREWIIYHGWLGVERWFVYDNNSDDDLQDVIDELNSKNYNVSRYTWPWIKAQEAGFSHCALRVRRECKWVGFFDVDEFFYLPPRDGVIPGQNSLKLLVSNYSDSPLYAEIRTTCHSFGPSGLTSAPLQGVTVGYTCRLQAFERHKSIVRPELLHVTLLNIVHHFRLREGYKYLAMPETVAVVNHYKYQAWETFKAKFFRRVSTYVVNWQEDGNKGSKDRAPGLGTQAIEPPNWKLRFCQVWDTGLKDFVLANFADTATGFLPWERSIA